ncbi:NAD(P)/FAD-dependent oxidoreductase [Thiomicrorhabdus chilensis]|uniref:NAD(P)/FAD-dependent oxidoreductase n=1 Tax=Thiomicrorhabdus chilensis TaxID=63656 RepID=UPI0003F7EB6D|nr:NAD(P)/FAD-dependent oxidoreductase [Thiomicrorhabdus chilensis]
MMKMNRRTLIKAMAAAGATVPMISPLSARAMSSNDSSGPKVVVIGGGFGGATCAKYLKRFDKQIEVTLVEPKKTYMTCPGSNWYLAGLVDSDTITHSYSVLADKHDVNVIHQSVNAIDAQAKTVKLDNGDVLKYDRLVVSPGIDFKYEMIEGYSEEVIDQIPHAYQAGPQTEILYEQIRDMKPGGTFVIAPPPNPFRCPPGPYERVSMVASYFKKYNPTAKILVLDAKNKFSKMGLFVEGWKQEYGDMITWIGAMDGGTVKKVDVATKTVYSDYDTVQADVLNIIPPQKAGKLAFTAGLTDDSGWCPVNQETFESSIHRGIHVIGDASIAGKMPKSGHSASSQGKMCAAAIVSHFHNWAMPRPKNVNTCYSLVAEDYGISVAAVYEMKDGKIDMVPGAGGVSPSAGSVQQHKQEADYARGWYKSITADIWNS